MLSIACDYNVFDIDTGSHDAYLNKCDNFLKQYLIVDQTAFT